jgi:hypothetical protein
MVSRCVHVDGVPCDAFVGNDLSGMRHLRLCSVLQILAQGGDPKEREYAKTIMPVRERGNLLLCTLLLGNTVSCTAIAVDFQTCPDGCSDSLLVSPRCAHRR